MYENSYICILKDYPVLSEGLLMTRVWANARSCTDEDIKRLRDDVCFEVSKLLPRNMYWLPDMGKIMGKPGQTLSIKEFVEIYDKAFDKVF